MDKAQENHQNRGQAESPIEDLLMAKVKAVAQSSHGELFARIVDDFFEQITEEYFSPEDLADIQGGLEEIKWGKYISWEECKRKHGL
jgi:hypothetical protein